MSTESKRNEDITGPYPNPETLADDLERKSSPQALLEAGGYSTIEEALADIERMGFIWSVAPMTATDHETIKITPKGRFLAYVLYLVLNNSSYMLCQ